MLELIETIETGGLVLVDEPSQLIWGQLKQQELDLCPGSADVSAEVMSCQKQGYAPNCRTATFITHQKSKLLQS